MIGPRIGPKFGYRVGGAFGVGADQAAPPVASWSVDAASGKGVPNTEGEWTTLFATLAGGGAPVSLHRCQESSGDLADTIGSMTLTASGTCSYNNAVTGWTRTALGLTDVAAGKWDTAGGPNPGSTSIAALLYMSVTVPGTSRWFLQLNTDASYRAYMEQTSGGLLRIVYGGGSNSAGSTSYNGGISAVFPVLYVFDRVNSRHKFFTNSEVVSATYSAIVTNLRRGLGGGVSTPPTSRYLYAAWWSGANAAWLSTDANAKSLLQALGWTVTGY